MMTYLQIKALRNRAFHYLSHEVAIFSGMNSLAELIRFAVGTFDATPEQLQRFANRTGGIPK